MANDDVSTRLAALCAERWQDAFITDARSGSVYTYGQFFSAAFDGMSALNAQGFTSDTTLALVVGNSPQTLALYTAALMAGVRIALVDPLKGAGEMHDVLGQVSVDAIVAEEPSAAFGGTHIPSSVFTGSFFSRERSIAEVTAALRSINAKKNYLVTFTSGSTGTPKGVMHSFETLCASAEAFGEAFGFNATHVFYHHLPMTYVAGVLNSFVLPLIRGSQIVVGERFSVAHAPSFWETPVRFGVNVFWFVPTMLALLLKLDRGTLGKDYAKKTPLIGCVGTAPLSVELHRRFESTYGIALYESYGLSETLFIATQTPAADGGMGSVGAVLPGAVVSGAPDHELLISAAWMYRGYCVGKKELPPESVFPSGDVGEVDDEGYLHITGRKKDLIIRGGINLSPRHVEEFLEARHVFEEAVLVGSPDEVMGERMVCFFVPQPSGFDESKRRALLAELHEQLGKEYTIDEFVELKEIPKLSNGKIDKVTLRGQFLRKT